MKTKFGTWKYLKKNEHRKAQIRGIGNIHKNKEKRKEIKKLLSKNKEENYYDKMEKRRKKK